MHVAEACANHELLVTKLQKRRNWQPAPVRRRKLVDSNQRRASHRPAKLPSAICFLGIVPLQLYGVSRCAEAPRRSAPSSISSNPSVLCLCQIVEGNAAGLRAWPVPGIASPILSQMILCDTRPPLSQQLPLRPVLLLVPPSPTRRAPAVLCTA